MKEFEQIKQTLSEKTKELRYLQKKAERSLKKAPEGTLVLSSSNGTAQYFYKTEKGKQRGEYIPKKNKKLITALAQKDYDLRFLKEVEKQIKQIDKILQNLPDKKLTDVYTELSTARKEFIKPHLLSDEEFIEQWLNVEYRGKDFQSEMPYQITEKGEKVRSKTEKILADKLFALGIPYRYEYPIKLRTFGTVYPDFTLLDISTRKEIYFEHFGMMDNPQYCQKAILKIQEYARNGIYLGKDLLVTFEISQISLDMNMVEEMLRKYFY